MRGPVLRARLRGRHRRDRSRTRRVLPLRGGGTIGGREGGRAVRPDVAGTGALFIYTIELKPTGGMRVLGPLLGPIVRSGLKKDLQKLRALLEADRPA